MDKETKQKALQIQKIRQFQSLPLDQKIKMTIARIKAFYDHFDGDVYVSFSGGKDSLVLLTIVRWVYPEVVAVFNNTGVEYPEMYKFVKKFDNVIWIQPKHKFYSLRKKYGYPVISKTTSMSIHRYNNTKDPEQKRRRLEGYPNGKTGMIPKKWQYLVEEESGLKISEKCCHFLKKYPFEKFERESGLKPYIGVMADESVYRSLRYTTCNSFKPGHEKSAPMLFWTEKDVWDFIKLYELEVCELYTKYGLNRTGCFTCALGCVEERKAGFDKFAQMKKTHPKLYNYCMNFMGLKDYFKLIFPEDYKDKEDE